MTTKAAFSPEEWKVVLEGPPTAGMIVVTAARGGTFRATIALAKAYAEARGKQGKSEPLDEAGGSNSVGPQALGRLAPAADVLGRVKLGLDRGFRA